MHRFFVTDQPLTEGATVDLHGIRHQLWRVLRLQPGDQVLLLDGLGSDYPTELLEVNDARATGRLLAARHAAGEPNVRLTLCQCVLKSDKFEWVLQKGTELGVSRFVPVISERTIVRPAVKLTRKYDRWRVIVREAAEQSGRGLLPELANPMTWEEALVDGPDSGQTLSLLPWERAEGEPGLAQTVGQLGPSTHPIRRVSLLVGPEGGISVEEMQQALAQGWLTVGMGPRILRAETAAISAIAITMSVLGEMK